MDTGIATYEVCPILPGIVELVADDAGRPYYWFPKMNALRPVGQLVLREYRAVVERWQAAPEHDVLRARGDPRWQAACSFCQRAIAEDQPDFRWAAPAPHLGDPGGYEEVDPDGDTRPIPF